MFSSALVFNIWQDLILGIGCSPLETSIHFLNEQDQKVNIPVTGENLSGLMGRLHVYVYQTLIGTCFAIS